MEKKKSKTFLAWLALGVGALIISTMAYFYSSHSFGPNIFRVAKYSVTTQELLDESAAQNLEVGQEIPAEISVTNNGEVPSYMTYKSYLQNQEKPQQLANI